MGDFNRGEIDVLVATTVVEVGRRRPQCERDGDPRRRTATGSRSSTSCAAESGAASRESFCILVAPDDAGAIERLRDSRRDERRLQGGGRRPAPTPRRRAGRDRAGRGANGTIGNVVDDFAFYMQAKAEAEAIVSADPDLGATRAPRLRALIDDVAAARALLVTAWRRRRRRLRLRPYARIRQPARTPRVRPAGRAARRTDRRRGARAIRTHRRADCAVFRAAKIPMEAMLTGFVATLPLGEARPRPEFARRSPNRYREICYALVDETGAPDARRASSARGARRRRRIPVGILTNGWSPLQERKIARALGHFPGPILVSDTIGAYKPSGASVSLLETRARLRIRRGSGTSATIRSPTSTARAPYGLRAVWIDERQRAVSGRPAAAPTARIDHLAGFGGDRSRCVRHYGEDNGPTRWVR